MKRSNRKRKRVIGFSDLPQVIKNSPFGLFIAIILLGLLLIFRGVLGCLIKILIRLPLNLTTPEKILEGDICNPNKIFQVNLGEKIIGLFKNEAFVLFILIVSLIIFLYFKFKNKK